jgi:hypothetical protein
MKLMYIRDNCRNPVGVIVFERNKEDNAVSYAYSVCAPSDKFDKKEGIRLAELRLSGGNFITLYRQNIKSTHDALREIMLSIEDHSTSVRAVEFARDWLDFADIYRSVD